jgi:thioesterase domain-containing protein
VVDENFRCVPHGQAGELLIGGAGLARGYLHRPEQNAKRFVADPFTTEPGSRLYRTGDLVRFLGDGQLEYLGRLDHQIKIHGYRIEPGEVEAILQRHPGVRQALVMAREDTPGEKRLVAYVAANRSAVLPGDLRGHARQYLPVFMVPSAYVILDAFPMTPNGKVDRNALLPPPADRSGVGKDLVLPRNDCERALASIWEDLLKVRPIGITDNFFELGGDSVYAAHMLSRVREQFGRELPISTLIHAATVEQLAILLNTRTEVRSSSCLTPIQPHGSKRPLFLVHGIGGEILALAPIARQLGPDQPVFGLRARGADGTQQPLVRVEDMAAHYLDEILAAQPRGPFLLGGYSFGSIVAFEMARQLSARGHQVGFLVFLDQELFDAYRRFIWRPKWLFAFACNLPHWVLHDCKAWPPGQRYRTLRSRLVEIKDTLLTMIRSPRGGPAEWKLQEPPDWPDLPQTLRRMWEANHQALMNYVPQKYSGRITVVRTQIRPLVCTYEADLGWGRYAGGGVEVVTIPGYHSTMVKEPYVGILAQRLRHALRKAQSSL